MGEADVSLVVVFFLSPLSLSLSLPVRPSLLLSLSVSPSLPLQKLPLAPMEPSRNVLPEGLPDAALPSPPAYPLLW